MTSTINASTSSGIVQTADTSGVLALQTVGTTALTINTSQQVAFTNAVNLPNTFGFKNRIINGAMMIDQRNAGASVTNVAATSYSVDRFSIFGNQASKFTAQQSSTAPSGFVNSLCLTSLSSYSVGSGEVFKVQQAIEGNNIADLAWGTASAKPVTLSFWVYSSLTGTFGGAVTNYDVSRSYPFSYTINSANTWEQKTVTIVGDTTGTWVTNNNGSMLIIWSLGTGSTYSGTAGSWAGTYYASTTGATSVVGTSGATWYITGVQLEKGSTATSFDYRPYGTELALCKRYFQTSFQNGGTPAAPDSLSVNQTGAQFVNGATTDSASVNFPVVMRTSPTVQIYSPLVSPALGKVRKTADGFIFSNGAATWVGLQSFVPFGGDAYNSFQYGWVATAEL